MPSESFRNTQHLSPDLEHIDDSETKKSPKRRIAIIDTSDALEEQARDMAEEKLTEAEGNLTGIKGTFSKIWKHNLFREYYRQKEIARAKKSISESGNLYIGENADQTVHDSAMNTVVDRFIQEHEEAIHTDVGEERRITDNENIDDAFINVSVRDLIREFATGNINEESFHEERNRIIADATGFSGKKLENAVNHTDNLFEIARQAKIAVEHGASIDAIDQEVEVIIGKAKIGVRTESKYSTVDRISAKIQSSKIGQFVNETTIATGVAIAYSVTAGLFERLARSKALAWGTFGASALIGGAVAGARESVQVEDERKQHSRERAKGKIMTPDMERRSEFEKVIYNTIPAKSLSESLRNISETIITPEEFFRAVAILADAESRIKLSDTERIDLLSYSDFKSIEQERLTLDIARAEAKVKLRHLIESNTITLPYDESFDELYASTLDVKSIELREGDTGMEVRDRLFSKMKRKKVAGAVLKGVATGLVIGGAIQETAAFFNDTKDGLYERVVGMGSDQTPKSVTALEGLRRWIMGEEPGVRAVTSAILPDGSTINLPAGVVLVAHPDVPGQFTFTKDGEIISEKIEFKDGNLTQASEDLLQKAGVDVTESITHIEQPTQITYTPQEAVKQHPDLFTQIHRNFWYDNNTAAFDRNELKLHWGGENNTGIDANGNYAFNIGKMDPDGSTFKNLSVDAQEAMREGKLKMLLSLSRDSQFNVVEVPIDSQGNAIIDPKSNIAQLFFKNEGGHVTFVGKFAEVGHQITPGADGIAQYEVLATHTGAGVEKVTEIGNVVVDTPVTSFGVLDQEPYVEPPMFLPVFGRTPLETSNNKKNRSMSPFPYYYGYGEGHNMESWAQDFSPRLKENPTALLHPKGEINWYFENQQKRYPNYLEQELKPLEEQSKEKMSTSVEAAICLAVAGHQEHANIYRALETYRVQKNKDGQSVWDGTNSKFEIFVYVNWPKGTDPKLTIDEINRFKQEHPEVLLRVYEEEITNGKVEVGWYKKKAFDLALRKHTERNTDKDILLIANDADMVYTSPQYLENIRTTMNDNSSEKLDALMGRYDLDPHVYEKYPIFHATMRFWQFMEATMRSKYGLIGTQGRNTILRGSSYAAVGGNRTRDFWADIEFGQLFGQARQENTLAYANSAWVMVDPRREIDKFKSGERIAYSWSDFNTRLVRGNKTTDNVSDNLDINVLANAAENNPLVLTFRNRLQEEVQAIITLFSKITPGYIETPEAETKHFADIKTLVERASGFMGLEMKLSQNATDELLITITSTEKLRKSLKEYKNKNRKETKLNFGNNRNPLL